MGPDAKTEEIKTLDGRIYERRISPDGQTTITIPSNYDFDLASRLRNIYEWDNLSKKIVRKRG